MDVQALLEDVDLPLGIEGRRLNVRGALMLCGVKVTRVRFLIPSYNYLAAVLELRGVMQNVCVGRLVRENEAVVEGLLGVEGPTPGAGPARGPSNRGLGRQLPEVYLVLFPVAVGLGHCGLPRLGRAVRDLPWAQAGASRAHYSSTLRRVHELAAELAPLQVGRRCLLHHQV